MSKNLERDGAGSDENPVLKMAMVVVVAITLAMMGLAGNVYAESESNIPLTPSYRGIFATVGFAQHNKGIGNGVGAGFGVRFERWGMKLCYIQNPEFDDSRISILPELFHQAPLIDLGNKRTGDEYGYDLDGYFNIYEIVSIYAGPGIYYIGMQDIKLEKYDNGSLSRSAFAGPKKVRYAPAGEAGIQINIPYSSTGDGRILVGAGYHTERGVTVDFGVRF